MNTRTKCFFHVGTAKTGTSAIQSALADSEEALRLHGYVYPDLAGKFERARAGLPTTGNASNIVRQIREGEIDAAIASVRPFQGSNLILSHEALANIARAEVDAFQRFVEGLRDLGFDPTALVMFRPQTEFIASFYLQQVKGDQTSLSFEDYVRDESRPGRLRIRYNWYGYAKALEQVFGESLKVMWYPAVARGEGVVAAAFRWLGLEPPAAPPRIVNASPGIEPVAVLRAANEAGRGGRKLADRFLKEAESRGWLGTRVTVSEADAKRIDALTAESNCALLRSYCPDVDPSQALAPIKVVPAQADEDLTARLHQLAGEISAQLQSDRRARRHR